MRTIRLAEAKGFLKLVGQVHSLPPSLRLHRLLGGVQQLLAADELLFAHRDGASLALEGVPRVESARPVDPALADAAVRLFDKRSRASARESLDVVLGDGSELRLARAARGSLLTSFRAQPSGQPELLLAYRRSAGFTAIQRNLLHLIHAESLLQIMSTSRPAPDVELSPRERETLAILMTGAPEKQIADRLGISPHTVHHYIKVVYRKLGVTSRAELMAWMIERGGGTDG
jgi:DNA-binding CsgD family transcriptional regulator